MRDLDDMVQASFARCLDGSFDALLVEGFAIIEAFRMAKKHRFHHIIVESDCFEIVNKLNSPTLTLSLYG